MIWEEMDYNKPKLTMTQRLSYEREPELFDIKGEDNYNEPDEPSVCVFDCDTFLTIKGHKLKVNYHITPGARYYIQQFTEIDNRSYSLINQHCQEHSDDSKLTYIYQKCSY